MNRLYATVTLWERSGRLNTHLCIRQARSGPEAIGMAVEAGRLLNPGATMIDELVAEASPETIAKVAAEQAQK